MIYLDNSATTRPFDCVADAVAKGLTESYFNVSSPYAEALRTEKKLVEAEKIIAASMNVKTNELIFTSGGTESDNTALFCTPEKSEIIVSEYEHHAILSCIPALEKSGRKVIICPVDSSGKVSPETLGALVNENTSLVSIMHVNNEIGSINDIKALSCAVKAKNPKTLFHSDGVQAYMHVCSDMKYLGIDLYSVSGHKIHGPKGIGVLYIRSGVPFKPYIFGGGQQENRRSGTVNVAGILGLAKAVETLGNDFPQKLNKVKAAYINALSTIPDTRLICPDSAPNILSISFSGIKASSLQNALENEVIIGKGSACTSRSSKISHVLDAIGLSIQEAESTVRLSFGCFNTVEEAEKACELIKEKVAYLRKYKRK